MDVRSVPLFGVNISLVRKDELLLHVIMAAKQSRSISVTYVNAHCINLLKQYPEYLDTLNTFDMVYADGMGVVYAGEWLRNAKLEKITGRRWIYDFCLMCEREGKKIYILAGKDTVAERAANRLIALMPNLDIVGVHHGYIDINDSDQLVDDINRSNADVLFVGMGVPIQEYWVRNNRSRLKPSVIWCVGALFDYVAGEEPVVPWLLERLNLEWFWRMLIDPRGKWKRYLVGLPKFGYYLVKEKFKTRED